MAANNKTQIILSHNNSIIESRYAGVYGHAMRTIYRLDVYKIKLWCKRIWRW